MTVPTKLIRPATLIGRTIKKRVNKETKLFLIINKHEGKLVEVFVKIGKGGGDVMCLCEAIGRMISLGLRYGIPVEEVITDLEGIGGGSDGFPSVPHAIAMALKGEMHGTSHPSVPV